MSINANYEQVEVQVKNIIIDHLQINKSPEELNANEEYFLEAYGFNSVDALELLLKIEQEFNIEIADEDLNADLLKTINSLATYVEKTLENKE